MSKLNKQIRTNLANHLWERIRLSCTIWTRWKTKKWLSALCLENIMFEWQALDHLRIEWDYSVPKWKEFYVEWLVYVYDDYSNYWIKDCLFISKMR